MNQTTILVTSCVAAGCFLSSCADTGKEQQKQQERPNILFILSDDHTSKAWGIYGGILADYVKNDNIRRPAHIGLRTDRYKLMFLYGDKLNTKGSEDKTTPPAFEFYDLEADPYENKNRYDDPVKMRGDRLGIYL